MAASDGHTHGQDFLARPFMSTLEFFSLSPNIWGQPLNKKDIGSRQDAHGNLPGSAPGASLLQTRCSEFLVVAESDRSQEAVGHGFDHSDGFEQSNLVHVFLLPPLFAARCLDLLAVSRGLRTKQAGAASKFVLLSPIRSAKGQAPLLELLSKVGQHEP